MLAGPNWKGVAFEVEEGELLAGAVQVLVGVTGQAQPEAVVVVGRELEEVDGQVVSFRRVQSKLNLTHVNKCLKLSVHVHACTYAVLSCTDNADAYGTCVSYDHRAIRSMHFDAVTVAGDFKLKVVHFSDLMRSPLRLARR